VYLASELSNENSKLCTNEKSSYLNNSTVISGWASAQVWAVHHFLVGRATFVVCRVCCDGCVESNTGCCNNFMEHWFFDVDTALMLSLQHLFRRGFTIRLKRLKPRAPDFGGPQNFGNKDHFQHFCKQLYTYFRFVSTHVFYYAANKRSLCIEKWARRIEVNDDEHSLFMALRIGYCYVYYVEQNAWIHFSDYTRLVR